MSAKRRVLVVFGTRPEAIKLAPLVRLANKNQNIEVRVCVTAQHREMLDQVLSLFEIHPDDDLDLMQPDQSLAGVASRVLRGVDAVVAARLPDLVVVQGDTATTLAAALAAYYRGIPVFHVEAGLRTGDLAAPWPEEGNRQMVSRIAARHFAATQAAVENLLDEGIAPSRILLTGNTVIDALDWVQSLLKSSSSMIAELRQRFPFVTEEGKLLLVTAHRRENFGDGFARVCKAIAELAECRPSLKIAFPVHPNPNVEQPVRQWLGQLANVYLMPPLEYHEFVFLMQSAYLILTDSGGIQEEAPFIGKPVLLMRECTERPEAVAAGCTRLVGTDTATIVEGVGELIDNQIHYGEMAKKRNLFGDGKASLCILGEIQRFLGVDAASEAVHA